MICDDDDDCLAAANEYVLRYLNEHPERFSPPVLYNAPLFFLGLSEQANNFDVFLLDIFMPGMSGIELGRIQRLRSKNSQLIFTTSTREFAVEAIAMGSVHYLVKPFTYEQLAEALDRAYENLSIKSIRNVSLKSRDGEIYKVNVGDVISIECFGHIQRISCREYSFEMRDSLPALYEKLLDARFGLIHKGIIVNMDHIAFVGADFIRMSDGRTLAAAKRNMSDFKRKYLDYTVGG